MEQTADQVGVLWIPCTQKTPVVHCQVHLQCHMGEADPVPNPKGMPKVERSLVVPNPVCPMALPAHLFLSPPTLETTSHIGLANLP